MPTIFPGDGKELGSVYALAVTYFFVATCGAMTSLAISLHFTLLRAKVAKHWWPQFSSQELVHRYFYHRSSRLFF